MLGRYGIYSHRLVDPATKKEYGVEFYCQALTTNSAGSVPSGLGNLEYSSELSSVIGLVPLSPMDFSEFHRLPFVCSLILQTMCNYTKERLQREHRLSLQRQCFCVGWLQIAVRLGVNWNVTAAIFVASTARMTHFVTTMCMGSSKEKWMRHIRKHGDFPGRRTKSIY